MKGNKTLAKWAQIILGVFLIFYALNKFLHFIPMSFGDTSEEAGSFLYTVAPYLPFLYVLELIIGLFLVLNKWSSFILIVLFPLSASFLMFSLINNDISVLWPALIVFFLNSLLLLNNRTNYYSLFD